MKKVAPKKTANSPILKDDSDKLLGKRVAPLSALNSKGERMDLFSGDKMWTVLFFYPKDDTPGCTIENKDFSSLKNEFKKSGVLVFGVSKDSVSSHNKFLCKFNFTHELISDESGALCDQFDVIKEKNMYGKKYLGIERSTFILNPQGEIVETFRKVKVEGHAQAVLTRVRKLKSS
jgi:peroxiredoxin Q/BCP